MKEHSPLQPPLLFLSQLLCCLSAVLFDVCTSRKRKMQHPQLTILNNATVCTLPVKSTNKLHNPAISPTRYVELLSLDGFAEELCKVSVPSGLCGVVEVSMHTSEKISTTLE